MEAVEKKEETEQMEEKDFDEKIKTQKEFLASLCKERDDAIKEAVQKVRSAYSVQIVEQERTLEDLKRRKYETGKLDYSDLKVKDLGKLEIIQMQYIIASVLGLDATYPLRTWRQSIFSRISVTGDISYIELTDKQYKSLLKKYITLEMSCRFCKSICHKIEACPTLKERKCDACGRTGHYIDRCRDLVALRKHKKKEV